MHHIGQVINEYRRNLGLTRSNLSKGICSEKFLYLVEKGERKPSAPMLRLFSNKLGVELFEFYQYMDCKEPIKVRDAMFQCSRLRRIGDFQALWELNERMKTLPDFGKKPWKYEIEVNRFAVMLYRDQEVQKAVVEMEALIASIEPVYAEEEFTAGLYGMLSNGYQILNDVENAKRASTIATSIVSNKKGNTRYNQIYTSVKLTAISLAYYTGEYELAIKEGLDITQYQEENSAYERLNITYYFLACAYYKNGQTDIAFQWFEKCLLNLLAFHSPSMAYYVTMDELYETLAGDQRVKAELLGMLKQFYAG